MLFKKSLEEFYREELFKTVSNCPDYQEYSPLDADKYVAMSLLQKAIRRGEFGFAISSALTLLNHNDRAFWKRMCVIAFEDVVHDLRHTYASIAAMNGIDLLTLGKILGHTNYQTTERYAHLADEGIRRAADTVSNLVAGAISQVSPNQKPHLRIVR